jgi:predicted RNA-binding protein YlqC (UPF0109 family)
MTNTQKLLETYLGCLGLDYSLKVSQEDKSIIFVINVPKTNNEKIGILKGKMGQNILNLRRILKIVASLENFTPVIIIKLEG